MSSITRPIPKVGDTLYSLNIGNEARGRAQVLTSVQVLKVGRKYFVCSEIAYLNSPRQHREYYLDDWREQNGGYCAGSKLYVNPQEYEDETESSRIRAELRKVFDPWGTDHRIPLASLREIRAIVAGYVTLEASKP